MGDFDYKKHSLEQLENWTRDSLVSAEATPQEIYDTIKSVVDEEYHYFKHHTGRCYELLALLNGNGKGHIKTYDDCVDKVLSCDKEDSSPECKGAWTSFWEENYYSEEHQQYTEEELNAMCDAAEKQDKVVKWQLPVEMDGIVMFPDDLLEAANLEEGDTVEWVDNGNGSFTLKKIEK